MSSEKILKKSTFGGFKRESVLNYIEELQAEILSLKKELNNSKALQNEIDILNDKSKLLEAEITELKEENKSLKAEKEELISANNSYCNDLSAARNTISDLEAKINIYEDKVSSIEKKFSDIETAYSVKSNQSDSKATVMMQDAVNYSEKIITKANETAHNAVLNADIAVNAALKQISDAANIIKSARSDYDSSASALECSVEKLSSALINISKNLNLTNETEAK